MGSRYEGLRVFEETYYIDLHSTSWSELNPSKKLPCCSVDLYSASVARRQLPLQAGQGAPAAWALPQVAPFGRRVSWTRLCWATPAGARSGESSSFVDEWVAPRAVRLPNLEESGWDWKPDCTRSSF